MRFATNVEVSEVMGERKYPNITEHLREWKRGIDFYYKSRDWFQKATGDTQLALFHMEEDELESAWLTDPAPASPAGTKR